MIEKVEIKREPESPRPTPIEDCDDRSASNYLSEPEDWDKDANEPSYTTEGRNLEIPAYKTVRRLLWGERYPACDVHLIVEFYSTHTFIPIELTFINVKLYMSWVWCYLWSDPFGELGYGVICGVIFAEILIGLLLSSSDWF